MTRKRKKPGSAWSKPRKGPLSKFRQYFRPFTTMGDISGGVERIRRQTEGQRPDMQQSGMGSTTQPAGQRPAAKQKKQPKEPKPIGKVKLAIVIVLALLSMGTVGYTARVILAKDSGAQVNGELEQYYDILTKEELKEWDEKVQQKGKAYVQMNTRVEMGPDGRAQIRLINPPYSNYDQNVIIRIKEQDKDVFQSGMMHPGTIIEYTDIPGLEPGLYNAVASFSFYNLEGVEKGGYELELSLEVGDGMQPSGQDNLSLDVPIIEQGNEGMPEMDAPTADTLEPDAPEPDTPTTGEPDTATPSFM